MSLADAVRETGARILIIDIETRPNKVWTWGLWDQNVGISQIIEAGGTMCFAAKWYGEAKVHFHAEHDAPRIDMIEAAWLLMDEADIIVGYNHRAFDVKHLHREFVTNGLGPPSPHKDVDLLTVARQRFKFPSNKLDWVSRELGVGFKVQHSGFDLWTGCMAGDAKAWRTMKRYNVHDVRLTEEVYDRLRPWIKGHPNLNLYRPQRVSGCSHCGSDRLEEAGFHYTSTRAYARWRCLVCAAYSRANQMTRSVHRTAA